MSVRVLSFSALALLITTVAMAADTGAPGSKPVLNRAPATLNDSRGIRGTAPVRAIQDDAVRGKVIRQGQDNPAADPVTVIRGQAPAGDNGNADVLPIDVLFHNMKSADCHPKGANPADLAKLQKSASCVELAKETEQLKIAYKGNDFVQAALADGRLR